MCCTPDAPDYSGANEAAQEQAAIAREQWDYYKTELLPFITNQMREDGARAGRLSDIAEAAQKYDLARQKRYDDRFWNVNVPLRDEYIERAKSYNEPEEWERLAGLAKADAQQAYKNSADQQNRMLAAYGVNPNSGKFVGMNNAMQMGRAALEAGGANATRQMARDKGMAYLSDAIALDSGMPGFSSQAASVGQGWGAQGLNSLGMNSLQAGAGIGNQYAGTAGGLYGQASGNMLGIANAQAKNQGDAFSGIVRGGMAAYGIMSGNPFLAGQAMSGFADGGEVSMDDHEAMLAEQAAPPFDPYAAAADHVERTIGVIIPEARMAPPVKAFARGGFTGLRRNYVRGGEVDGPGGPTDDMIPAKLSDGEFVLNAEAVKHYGLDKLEKMNQKGLQLRAGKRN